MNKKCQRTVWTSAKRKRTQGVPKISIRQGRGFKTREKVDVEVEVKGTSENTGLHLELDLWREEASAPYVRQRRLGGYYWVQDERVLIGCKKRGKHYTFRLLCPEVILGEKAEMAKMVILWAPRCKGGDTKVKLDLFSRIDRTFPTQTGQKVACTGRD